MQCRISVRSGELPPHLDWLVLYSSKCPFIFLLRNCSTGGAGGRQSPCRGLGSPQVASLPLVRRHRRLELGTYIDTLLLSSIMLYCMPEAQRGLVSTANLV